MSNNIPIDELFREKLSGGKEQLNLGAWANMERMLNGQNPYTNKDQEPKRKKRILPFFLVFLTLSAAVSAGYVWYNHDDNSARNLAHASTSSNVTNPASNNDPSNTDQQISNTPNQINLSHSATAPNQNNLSHAAATSGQINASLTQNVSSPVGSRQRRSHTSSKQNGSSEADQLLSEQAGESAMPAGEVAAKSAGSPRSKSTGKSIGKLLASAGNEADAVMKSSYSEAESVLDVQPLAANAAGKVKTERRQMKRTVAEVREAKNRNGSTARVLMDTIEESNVEIEKQVAMATQVADHSIKDKNYKWHPRYVVGAEDYVAEQDILQSRAPVVSVPASTPHLETPADGKGKPRNNEKRNVLTTLGAFTGATLAKIGESGGNFFRMFTVLDPGISLGVNAALFNTMHNYGGFHGGLTNHTAISETFSIISELKFFIRNNSGFTINDIKTIIKTTSEDTFSMPGKTIYTYQIDSATKKYNFKNFMSLELPVMLSARFNNLSVYGGPNFVYNMKLKISEIDKSYLVNKEVIVDNGTPFHFPYEDEKSMQYARTDFGARFGIGYAVGISYNFNPNIYLDLRLNKVMWDNTTTNSQRAVSNGVTKVPFTQLSLGYKFKNK